MTEIAFHFNVPDRTAYACRLLRKATRRGARTVVTGSADQLERLDRELWSFDPTEFIPHVRARSGTAIPGHLRVTPVWLVEEPDDAAHPDVLVNLGAEPPAGFESYERMIEIVSTEDDDRVRARQRWKHYASRGYPITRHEAGK